MPNCYSFLLVFTTSSAPVCLVSLNVTSRHPGGSVFVKFGIFIFELFREIKVLSSLDVVRNTWFYFCFVICVCASKILYNDTMKYFKISPQCHLEKPIMRVIFVATFKLLLRVTVTE